MSTTSEQEPFVEHRFIEDVRQGAAALETPFSEDIIKEVIQAYGDHVDGAAVLLLAGSEAKTPLSFRLFFSTPVDTMEIALKHGWLANDDSMVQLHRSLEQQFPESIEQSSDFTVDKGCEAIFQYLGKNLGTLDKLLETPNMPDAIKANRQQFMDVGLNNIFMIQSNYQKRTLGFSFLAKGPLTKETLTKYAAMTGAPEPSDAIYADIVGMLVDHPYYATVVQDFDSGRVMRFEMHLFFPIKLEDMTIPEVGDRIATFFDIPSYEVEDMDILTYCFGNSPLGAITAFRSHCGGFRATLKSWGAYGV